MARDAIGKAAGIPPSETGTLAFSIPQAGRMIGLSRNAAYEAAKRGEIPTLEFGARKIVPSAIWLRMLGADNRDVAAKAEAAA